MKNDNKLIAEFMGAFFDDNGMTRICGQYGLERVNDLSLKYHTSWDWLMPVVEKIEIEGFDPHGMIDNALGSREIEDVHDTCVTLIKAHNYEEKEKSS